MVEGGWKGEVDGVKGVKYVMTERNLTMGGKCTMLKKYTHTHTHTHTHTDTLPLKCTGETYWISLTNVTIKNKLKKRINLK